MRCGQSGRLFGRPAGRRSYLPVGLFARNDLRRGGRWRLGHGMVPPVHRKAVAKRGLRAPRSRVAVPRIAWRAAPEALRRDRVAFVFRWPQALSSRPSRSPSPGHCRGCYTRLADPFGLVPMVSEVGRLRRRVLCARDPTRPVRVGEGGCGHEGPAKRYFAEKRCRARQFARMISRLRPFAPNVARVTLFRVVLWLRIMHPACQTTHCGEKTLQSRKRGLRIRSVAAGRGKLRPERPRRGKMPRFEPRCGRDWEEITSGFVAFRSAKDATFAERKGDTY